MTLDGVVVDDGTDFARLAEAALRGQIGSATSFVDYRLGWLFSAWPQLSATQFGPRLAAAIGNHVVAGDRETKHGALLFFVSFPDAGRLAFAMLEAACRDRAGVRGVEPPDGGSADLEWWLLRAVASVAAIGEPAALRIIEREALRADGKVEPIMHTLITSDADWFRGHRGEVLQLHPEINELVRTIETAD